MFKEFFLFEIKYQIRKPLIYMLSLAFFSLSFFFTSVSDNVNIMGFMLHNVEKSSPYLIMAITGSLSTMGIYVVTAFMTGAALKDTQHNYSQILYSTPLDKFSFLFGKFIGAIVLSLIPLAFVSLGILFGGGISETASIWTYLYYFLIFTVPNILFSGALFYTIAVLTRSQTMAFVSNVIFMFGLVLAMNVVNKLESEWLTYIIDPVGIFASQLMTKYWTVADKNTILLPITGWFLINRVIYLGIGFLLLLFLYMKFSFTLNKKVKVKKIETNQVQDDIYQIDFKLPIVTISHTVSTSLNQLKSFCNFDLNGIIKSLPFRFIAIIGLIQLMSPVFFSDAMFGAYTEQLTHKMIEIIRSQMGLFNTIILIFYSGILVWKERESRLCFFL